MNMTKHFVFIALALTFALMLGPDILGGSCMYCMGGCQVTQRPTPGDCQGGLYDDCNCVPLCDCRDAGICAECQGEEEESPDLDQLVLSDGWILHGKWISPDAFGVRSNCGSQMMVYYTDEGLRSRRSQAGVLMLSTAP
jgi:hypothetical protein